MATASTSTSLNVRTSDESNKRKRRLSTSCATDSAAKKILIEPEAFPKQNDKEFNILDFSDEMLLEIFLHCNSLTLFSLSKTCYRFQNLINDRRLWKSFDFSKKKMSAKEIRKILSFATKDTKEFIVRGLVSKYPLDKWKNNTLSTNILLQLSNKCPDLETLAVYDGCLNFKKIFITEFPSSLKRLILNGCQIATPRSPRLFNKIDLHLQLLEELSLEKCPWFETHDLVVFSKLPHLKKLNLRSCNSLKECVPYGSIATRFGFKSLEYLDIRNTPISDSDLQCFNITATMREILMECPIALRSSSRNQIGGTAFNQIDLTDDEDAENDIPMNASKNDDGNNEEDTNAEALELSDIESETNDESADSDENNDEVNKDGTKANANDCEHESTSQNHCIQVILQDGRLLNVNTERSVENDNQMREHNGIRYMIGVVNGGGPEEVLQRLIEHREAEQNNRQRAQNQQQSSQASAASSSSASSSQMQQPKSAKPNNTNEQGDRGASVAENHSSPGPSKSQAIAINPKTVKQALANANDSSTFNTAAGPSNQHAESNGNIDNRPRNRNENPDQEQPAAQRLIIIRRNNEPSELRERITWELENRTREAASLLRRLNNRIGHFAPILNQYNSLISDRGLCSFGMPRNNAQEGIIWIRAELRPADTLLERITVRFYRSVTDVTLRHLATCAPNLQYLDVTGTSVTQAGIEIFLALKPNCEVVSDFSV